MKHEGGSPLPDCVGFQKMSDEAGAGRRLRFKHQNSNAISNGVDAQTKGAGYRFVGVAAGKQSEN